MIEKIELIGEVVLIAACSYFGYTALAQYQRKSLLINKKKYIKESRALPPVTEKI